MHTDAGECHNPVSSQKWHHPAHHCLAALKSVVEVEIFLGLTWVVLSLMEFKWIRWCVVLLLIYTCLILM